MQPKLPSVLPLKNIASYRYIRFIRQVRYKYEGIEVFFDTEKIAQLHFSRPEDFVTFLDQKHNLLIEHEDLLIQKKRAVSQYNITYVIDIKKWTLVLFEEPPPKRKTIKEEINEELRDITKARANGRQSHNQAMYPQVNIRSTSNKSWLPF